MATNSFERNKIYFPEPVCELMAKFVRDVRSPIIRFGMQLGLEQQGRSDPTRKLEVWIEAVEVFDKELPAARAAIEEEFRRMLGAA
jgi:hypothetical protein